MLYIYFIFVGGRAGTWKLGNKPFWDIELLNELSERKRDQDKNFPKTLFSLPSFLYTVKAKFCLNIIKLGLSERKWPADSKNGTHFDFRQYGF